jgi:hypothetical protein
MKRNKAVEFVSENLVLFCLLLIKREGLHYEKYTLVFIFAFRFYKRGEGSVLVHREMEKWQPCYSSQTGGLNHETET